MALPRVASYALLDDLRSTALVAQDGAIDWFALPTMDAAPVGAALLIPSEAVRSV